MRHAAALVVVVGVLGGCSTEPREPSAAAETQVEVPDADGALASAADVLDLISATGAPEPNDLGSLRLSQGLDSQVVAETIGAMAEMGPWEWITSETVDLGHTAELVVRSHDGRHVTLHVSVDAGGNILGLWFGHAVDRSVDSKDVTGVEAEVARVPGRNSVSLWRLDDARCSLVATSGNEDARLPLASVSKLYVAAAALRAVQKGDAGWDDRLSVTDANRSLPSGALATAPAGTPVSLGEATVAAMLESDNTANDLIIEHVGVDAVMDAARDITGTEAPGHFWTTREVFEIGWGARRADPPDFDPNDPSRTNAFRETYAGEHLTVESLDVHTPRWQDGVDWYASSRQLCAVAGWLDSNRQDLPEGVPERLGTSLQESVTPDGTWLWKPGGAPGVSASLGVFEHDEVRYVITSQFASLHVPDVADTRGLQLLAGRFAEAMLESPGLHDSDR